MQLKSLALKSYLDNSDLQPYVEKRLTHSTDHIRRNTRICIIDDEPFQARSNLLAYGFQIDELNDIADLASIREYQIVIVDLIGVGKHFNKMLEGASLVDEISKRHPEKIVITYTGASRNDRSARKAQATADFFLKKDLDLEEFVTTLDTAAKNASNPIEIWHRIRKRLINLEVSTKIILKLEDAYVRSIRKNDQSFTMLKNYTSHPEFNQDIRNIITNFISSAAIALIFS